MEQENNRNNTSKNGRGWRDNSSNRSKSGGGIRTVGNSDGSKGNKRPAFI